MCPCLYAYAVVYDVCNSVCVRNVGELSSFTAGVVDIFTVSFVVVDGIASADVFAIPIPAKVAVVVFHPSTFYSQMSSFSANKIRRPFTTS